MQLVLAPLLILFLFSCRSYAQDPLSESTVTLKISNRPLHLVLDHLTEQTGFYFTFDARLIDSEGRKSVDVEEASLRSVLDQLLPDNTFRYRIIHRNVVIYPATELIPGEMLPAAQGATAYSMHGNVTDESGRRPLAYATVGVVGTRFGTITNSNGQFRLVLPDTVTAPIISVSFIGYKTAYYPVSMKSEAPLEIRLEKQYISIQEVIIRRQDPLKLIDEAVNLIPENYVNEPSGAVAYYRERVKRNEHILVFSEAVIEMARPAYSNSFREDRIRLLRGRKISSVSPRDTVLFRISSGLNSMLTLDIVKNLPDFLAPENTSLYDFTFSDIVTYRDQLVYVIGFRPKEYINETLFRGQLYLDQQTLAIVAADFEYDPSRIGVEADMFVTRRSPKLKIRPVAASYHVDYNVYDGKYYLGQVQGSVDFRVRRKRQWIASRYSISLEMAVTSVRPGDPPDIQFSESLRPKTILSEQEFEFDPDFWGSYNTIVAESSLKEALENIEKSMQEISGGK